MLKFNGTVKSVTANVAKKVVTISLSFPMDDESMQVADALAFYANKMPVGVIVTPKQLTLDEVEKKESA
jgi:hypothetical protein